MHALVPRCCQVIDSAGRKIKDAKGFEEKAQGLSKPQLGMYASIGVPPNSHGSTFIISHIPCLGIILYTCFSTQTLPILFGTSKALACGIPWLIVKNGLYYHVCCSTRSKHVINILDISQSKGRIFPHIIFGLHQKPWFIIGYRFVHLI